MSVTHPSGEGSGLTPLDLPLDRSATTFIEASAGTGKTRALTTLVARLVVEEGRPLDRILVVTFTRAATAELRDRIRSVLGATLAAARARGVEGIGGAASATGGGEHGMHADAETAADSQASELLAAWEGRGGIVDRALVRRLETAMRDVDRANIHTIHGFCQRVLADHAFESGFPFGFEVHGGDGGMVVRAVRDSWRRRLYPASTFLTRYAVNDGFVPEAIEAWVASRRAKSEVAFVGGDPLERPIESHEAAWREAFDATRVVWEECRGDFLAEMREGSWLNRSRYRARRTERELAAIEALLSAPEPGLPEPGVFGRYGAEQLSQACKRSCALPANPLFDAFDRLEEASGGMRAACDRWLRWNRRNILTEVRGAVRRTIRDERRVAYDDLLIELDEALDGAGGKRLAQRIRRTLPCALVDEYQDTDPLQTRIFSRIYGMARPGSDGAGDDSGQETPDLFGASGPEARAGDGGAAESARGERPGPFIVVGDPKQSIYRFRGADVFAYLAFRRAAHGRLHLDRNWRSVPALVDAVNALFAGAEPFVTPGIEYRPVSAAAEPRGALRLPAREGGAALELWLLPRNEDGKPLAKKDAGPTVAAATAGRIVELLECGERGEATIEGEPLAGGDMAVLVRTRDQGRMIAAALRERGVRSVEIDDGSVFHTREAEHLERLLWVIAEPARESRIRGALAGDLFGLDIRALRTLGDDEDDRTGWIERIAQWRRHWESRGIGSVILRILEGEGSAKHLLAHPDGARRLTNYRHLAELLQEAESRERLAPAEVATWLNHRRVESGAHGDSAQLRLESDEQLVRILTVHGSKGLEFPVVFCPFAWDGRAPRSGPDATYHLGASDGYREVLDLDPGDAANEAQWTEEFAESVRLVYVAVTRAQFRCFVAWGQVNGAERSPLAWLLHRPVAAPAETSGPVHGRPANGPGPQRRADAEPVSEAPRAHCGEGAPQDGSGAADADAGAAALQRAVERFATLDPSQWRAEIDAFVRRLPEAISVVEIASAPIPVRAPATSGAARPALAALDPARPLRRVRSLTSFSALLSDMPAPAGDPGRSRVGEVDAGVDRPDHDQSVEPDSVEDDASDSVGAGRARNAFTFPRGPIAGTCLHRMFERLDLRPGPGEEPPDIDQICGRALAEFGIAEDWRPVARGMVERTRALRLHEPEREGPGGAEPPEWNTAPGPGGGFRLADPLPRLVELEFHFPVGGLDRRCLGAVLAEHGYPDPFRRPGGSGAGDPHPALHGFLRGFVDLVVEHAGRWYVVDYKSNWLGATPDDYAPHAVSETMRRGGYALQSLIYLVALHRYLATRLRGYEYGRHVGGSFYLFVRGIDPAAGMDRGVHFDRPTAACLHALDACFRGEAA